MTTLRTPFPVRKEDPMRSSDRSLITSLGFADPDKRERLHDLACQFLGEGSVAPRLLDGHRIEVPRRALRKENLEWIDRKYEVHFARNNVRSLTTIGFLDLLIEYGIRDTSPGGLDELYSYFILVEVKIHPVPVGDILRQMGFYQEHMLTGDMTAQWHHSVVATAFDLGPRDVEALYTKGIHHIRLRTQFREFCEERERETSGPSSSPEF
jgi:hypothetical protein